MRPSLLIQLANKWKKYPLLFALVLIWIIETTPANAQYPRPSHPDRPSSNKSVIQKLRDFINFPEEIFSSPEIPDQRPVNQHLPTSSRIDSRELINVSHQREFRGVWVATVANIDWPSANNLTVEKQKAEMIAILDRMQSLNLNALILQVRPNGDALYDSNIEPWSGWLTGTQGKAPSPMYDPLEFAIAESHKRNIELHTWFNPYRAKMPGERYPLAANHIASMFPQYAYQYGDLLWMDPGAQDVQDRAYNVIMDVVRRYDVDGIHIDDYFYPYPQEGVRFPDNATYAAYQNSGGTLGLADWRRKNVNDAIERIWNGIKAEKPHVKFGISPFGIYRPGKVKGIVGLDQYDAIFADVKKWMDEGWLDYLAPQLYWRIDPPQQSYPVLLDWWVENNPMGRHIYAGNYLSQLEIGRWPLAEFKNQVIASRKEGDRLSQGNIFFSMAMFSKNVRGVNEYFKKEIYPSPSLPPTMTWLDETPPQPPMNVRAEGDAITWQSDDNDIRSWTIYRRNGEKWELFKILNGDSRSITGLSSGDYAVCSVDRMANESPDVMVSL